MKAFDVQQFTDGRPITLRHIWVLALFLLIVVCDGYDIYVVGALAPAIANHLGASAEEMTLVFVLQQVGLALGIVVFAPFADQLGRKRVLLVSLLVFGTLTLLTPFITDLNHLAVLRGIASVALGPALPVATVYMSEFAPKRWRATSLSILLAGYTLGGLGVSAVGGWLLEDYGWQIGFWIGGLVPLAAAFLLLLTIKESLHFTVRKQPDDPAIPGLIEALDPEVKLDGSEQFTTGEEQAGAKTRFLDVFSGRRARYTLLLWIAFFMCMGDSALKVNWISTFFHEFSNVPLQDYLRVQSLSAVGGVCGALLVGFLSDRFKLITVVVVYNILNGVMIACLGLVPFDSPAFPFVMVASGFFQAGSPAGLIMLAAQGYPTSIRTTGLSWAKGIGRLGAIVLPMLGGLLVVTATTITQALGAVAIPPFLAALAVLALARYGGDQSEKHTPLPVTPAARKTSN